MEKIKHSFDKTNALMKRLDNWQSFFIVLGATCMMLGILFFIGGFNKPLYFYFSAGAIVLGIVNFFIEVILNFMKVFTMNIYNISTIGERSEIKSSTSLSDRKND